MTYQETCDYLFSQTANYEQQGATGYKPGLDTSIALDEHYGHPHEHFRSIHVAGTNGKGSVSHFLASILQETGYKVGLYTSPHLVDFRERIRINGEMIPQSAVVDFVYHNRDLIDKFKLSFFEMTVGLAFNYFAKEKVDIAVIEVGMGGRLDSTNVITPLLSVITNIGLDHTQFLGDTVEKIAVEKAGIIKDGIPVVIGETQTETKPVFERIAAVHRAPITFADEHYRIDCIEDYTTELIGEYQKQNIATVLQTVDVLRGSCPHKLVDLSVRLTEECVRRGLARVVTNTHLQGRWQTIGESPLTICETAHNEPGIRAMIGKLQTMSFRRLHLIYGCVNDKDYGHILQLLNSQLSILNSQLTWYFSQPSVPRRLPVVDLMAAAQELGIEGKGFESVKEAISVARTAAAPDDLVLVTGSIFLVADALA